MAAVSLVFTALLALAACGPSSAGGGSGIVLGPGTGPHTLTIPGDSLDKLARNPLVWSAGDTARRRCSGGLSCFFSGGKVRVVLSADTGARNRAPSVGAGTVLIGKLENLGRAADNMYGLKPGPFNYLVFVVPGGTADTGRFVVVQVNKNPPYSQQIVSNGPFAGCKHNSTWTKSFGVFRSCADGPPAEPVASLRSRGAGMQHPTGIRTAGMTNVFGWLAVLQGGVEDPAWYTCTSGCCTAGFAETQ
ncbi:MAG: hypothetical protein ACR2GJ_00525 [Gemmatimonadaceae bacterium]